MSNGNMYLSNSTSNGKLLQLEEHPIENFRRIRVIVIGAGYSGIYAGIRIPEKLRNVELVIYEKNEGVGGTWWENRYPGCACDVPAYSYQYSFSPNPSWSSFYAPAPEIRAYLHGVAERFSVDRFIKTSHKVTECRWNNSTGKWVVSVEDLKTGKVFLDEAEVVVSARGTLNDIAWPKIPGFETFTGEKMHSAAWNQNYDFRNKKIGVIGGGSSSIQIVPKLQQTEGASLKCFVRSKTWIGKPFGEATATKLKTDGLENPTQIISKLETDPQYHYELRKFVETDANSRYELPLKGSKTQDAAKANFVTFMKERLAKKPEIFQALVPDFDVTCRRLTPGPGYLEALQADNVEFIPTKIQRVHRNSVELSDGRKIELDVLVCATGFNASAPPPFDIIGRNNLTLDQRFTPFPETYMSLVTDGFPNFFMMNGPNSAVVTGSLTIQIEAEGDYIVKAIRKIQREGIKTMEAKASRVQDFCNYSTEYFKRTVLLDNCRSWYRSNGGDGDRISGPWPGTTLHFLEAFRSPRWEDFDYVYEGEKDGKEVNRLLWFGNGVTDIQENKRGDLAWYLEPEYLEVPEIPPEKNSKYEKRPFCG